MPMDEPWIIRNRKALLAGIVICAIVPIAFLAAIAQSPHKSLADFGAFFVVSVFFILCASVLHMFYKPAKKYAELISTLNFDLVDLKYARSTLTCTTLRHGTFSLQFFGGSKYEGGFYKLWITTQKPPPVPLGGKRIQRWKMFLAAPWSVSLDGRSVVLWREPMFKWAKSIANIDLPDIGVPNVGLPDNISKEYLNEIKSLREIKIEAAGTENRITAIFHDKWLYSETTDILSTLEVLRAIEEGM